MDHPAASHASPPTSPSPAPGIPTYAQRPNTATMRTHNRSQSRMADVGSRTSDDDANANHTAVKVVVRVRPPLQPSDPGYDLIPQRFRESTCKVASPTQLNIYSPRGREEYFFDRIFGEETSQEGVWNYLSDSVTSFVKGYNVSILAYGQSGAGKSYTMGTSGPQEQDDPDIKGIVPRAAQALFEQLSGPSARPSGMQTPKRYSVQMPNMASVARGMNGGARNWELKATYVEIYNEQLRDLLLPESHERGTVAIREDTKGRIMLTGLTQVTINTAQDVLDALNFGSTIRQTDATAINARSSRSHAVFSLNLVMKRTDVPAVPTTKAEKRRSMPIDHIAGTESILTTDSKLHFVDLAGSERLKNTGATGERAKEGISINAGLASLGKVISQLSKSSKHSSAHISYRDSRLTRLLQDSLGGNAITFMIACVTPAQFHLSETLNTVSYALRARSIQSRPQIQQSHEDGDKQAAIDRLRAEVSFLRDQIRHSDGAGGRGMDDRSRGRENELDSELLDMRENYKALSQRHVKLIAEISKSRDSEDGAETPLLNEAIGAHASDRIKRTASWAEAVEQVVLEYEKTIQSLETSLSKTRSSLASTEDTLLEKETRIAYMETIQTQLQSRVQKYMDREADNDNYTRNLEDQMEGATTEEERNSTLIAELRKEVARARDSEVGAEEYISTLEERLAEAEQDQEIMQREIDRLEHVIERQRSIGRLDNILGELDGVRGEEPGTNGMRSKSPPAAPKSNGHEPDDYDPFRTSTITAPSSDGFEKIESSDAETPAETQASSVTEAPRSPAQNEFMAEKLESLTQEFFDLRSEHETVLTDYDVLQQKYRTALETLAKLEYDKDIPKASRTVENGHDSFLADAGTKDEEKATDGQSSSSRSLSEVQSSQELPNTGAEPVEERIRPQTEKLATETSDEGTRSLSPVEQDDILQEMETLKKLHAEKEVSVAELTRNYMSLAQRHEATLSRVEDLKQEVQKAHRASSPTFPNSPSYPKNLRRRSEELLSAGSDRASRSLVSLKALVYNNFEEQADVRQTFDQNLNHVMAELHGRSERVQTLEAEIAAVKKEMETKQTIIAGLTRERSSLAASTAVDFSVVGQMRDQLMESENQIRNLHEQHAAREAELQAQVESLKTALAELQHNQQTSSQDSLPTPSDDLSHMPGEFPHTPALMSTGREVTEDQAMAEALRTADDSETVARLQNEVAAWETKHREAISSMTASQNNLLNTISELQDTLRTAESGVVHKAPANNLDEILDQQRLKHQEIIDSLTSEVEKHRSIADERVAKLDELQQSYDRIVLQVQDEDRTRDATHKELATHRDLVANLESQLQVHKSAITIHQESLESLQSSHSKEIDELRDSMEILERDWSSKYEALEEHYEKVTFDLERELSEAQGKVNTLLLDASSALGYETNASKLRTQIKGLVDEGKELHGRHLKTTNELKAVQEELQSAINRSVEMESHISELKMVNDEQNLNLDKMTDKYNKSAALCEQLEEQLNSTFDTHQATTNRLSTLQSESGLARIELEKELEEAKFRNSQLEQQLTAFKHMSMASNGSANFNRESLSPEAAAVALSRSNSNPPMSGTTVLPTPPPSIPLPPLPQSPTSGTPPMGSLDNTTSPIRGMSPTGPSPPTSRHGSREVPPSPAVTQLLEEQEARIRTIEKHLFAEKQLTATLEEALVDLETSANRTKSEMENWRKKCSGLEDELVSLRKERTNSRASMQAVEEEREMRLRAERARQALEQRMQELNTNKKKKNKSGLNCF